MPKRLVIFIISGFSQILHEVQHTVLKQVRIKLMKKSSNVIIAVQKKPSVSGQLTEQTKNCIQKKNICQVAAFYAWMKWAQWQGISQVLKGLSLYLESTSSTISHFEECNWSIQ